MNGSESRQMMEQRQQQAEAMRLFAQAFAAGASTAQAKDRFDRPIEVGMKVLYHPPFDLIFDVVDVHPVLDPRMQPGMVEVVVTATFPVKVPVQRGPVPNFVIVAMAEPADPTKTADQAPADGSNVVPGAFGQTDAADRSE